ncbi:hypothetical protein [Lactobacillus sp. LL6]|uniref:hypothetical protein n=1 Tax=Lactobacillus sp. LL6 TaxID=2596827 RepID=UPI001185817C|nr:hypothetical protein [Lactobacillus sp. LL6]TSO25278.1 hypothetical protein FOD82_08545 [Lactobacillus sp. LL6]
MHEWTNLLQVLLTFVMGVLTWRLSNKKTDHDKTKESHDYIKEENNRLNDENKRLTAENEKLREELNKNESSN